MNRCLIGAGGFAREIKWHLNMPMMKCFVDDEFYKPNDNEIYPLSEFNPNKYYALIAIGDSQKRFEMANRLPKNTKYWSYVHRTVELLDPNIEIGEGSFICANCVLTTNIKIGKHAHLNLLSTIGHDVTIGDFFTTAPGAKISGNCNIGDRVYIGTNACTRQKVNICNDVTIGLMSGVVKDIIEPGIYVGSPTRKLK